MKASRIELKGPTEIALPDGSVWRAQPGPYGKGISLVPLGNNGAKVASRATANGRGRGRPPNPSTDQLRVMLRKDAAAGKLHEASHYIDWLSGIEKKAKATTIQQTVYRELRQVRGGKPAKRGRAGSRKAKGAKSDGSGPGRQPHPATLQLREKLSKDKPELKDASHYIRWLVDAAGIGLRQARPIVYRELRAAR